MSTLIQFRVSGEDEIELLAAALRAGMRPADFVRQSAKLAVRRPDTALNKIEQRLTAMEAKLDAAPSAKTQFSMPSTHVTGMDASELILAVRRETRAGVSAFLVLLDAEPLPDVEQDG